MIKAIMAFVCLYIAEVCYKISEYHIKKRNQHHLKARQWLDKGNEFHRGGGLDEQRKHE